MMEVSIIGIDIAKNVFQFHGSTKTGATVFRRKIRRSGVLHFLAEQPRCLVAMEACASSHYWGREIEQLGHTVKLIPPQYVRPFVKRQKNDMADAEAIAEAATRPEMRFVAVKSAEQQARSMLLKTRELFLSQRTQTINMLRGHLAEYGIVVPQGPSHLRKLEAQMLDEHETDLPLTMRNMCIRLFDHLRLLDWQIDDLTSRIEASAKQDATARRLMTIPGIGPMCAMAVVTLAPPRESFRKGRDFAAWVGLTPKQHSTGGKTRLGRTSKMGQRDIRRLLILGAMSVIQSVERKGGAAEGSWLNRMLKRKPRLLVAVALANKLARMAWALMKKDEVYRVQLAA
ncbi:IS110 family transposase [Pseudovibrio sp. Ad5]|uniref:IS110 family transposase n=1 Tax=Pseudovibrio sp. Ad5 TaxID=989436 RepID=UPI0007AEB229|nr:IS110 family transposase [Pseudovibrio sp. Ad5]